MRNLVTAALALSSLVALSSACTPKPTTEALPPAGLAGAPDAVNVGTMASPSAALTTLPGMGHDVAPPTGGTDSAGLPPGHPPIDTAPVQPMMGAPAAPSGDAQLTGAVLEVIDVPSYTYLRVKTSAGEEWTAVNTVPVKVGDTVVVSSQLVMENFKSSSLNRTFPKLVMGMLIGSPKSP